MLRYLKQLRIVGDFLWQDDNVLNVFLRPLILPALRTFEPTCGSHDCVWPQTAFSSLASRSSFNILEFAFDKRILAADAAALFRAMPALKKLTLLDFRYQQTFDIICKEGLIPRLKTLFCCVDRMLHTEIYNLLSSRWRRPSQPELGINEVQDLSVTVYNRDSMCKGIFKELEWKGFKLTVM